MIWKWNYCRGWLFQTRILSNISRRVTCVSSLRVFWKFWLEILNTFFVFIVICMLTVSAFMLPSCSIRASFWFSRSDSSVMDLLAWLRSCRYCTAKQDATTVENNRSDAIIHENALERMNDRNLIMVMNFLFLSRYGNHIGDNWYWNISGSLTFHIRNNPGNVTWWQSSWSFGRMSGVRWLSE